MSLLVDTSVWSLAFRRDGAPSAPEVFALQHALLGAEQVFITKLVLQELLQGFNGPRAKGEGLARMAALACVQPDREAHVQAAALRNNCRRHGVPLGTIDALLIQLCRRHELTLLSAHQDFAAAARWVDFRLWRGA